MLMLAPIHVNDVKTLRLKASDFGQLYFVLNLAVVLDISHNASSAPCPASLPFGLCHAVKLMFSIVSWLE